jgi:hypothetical protein
MGTTLTGTTPQDTYDSLIKVTDNGPLSGTAKYLSDGLGNDSALALSTTAVGVGTSSLFAELQVNKASDVTLALSNSTAVTSGNRGSLSFYNSAVSTVALIKATAVTDNVGTQLEFYTRPAAGSLAQTMTITSSGNVGIGTPTPTATLDARIAGTTSGAVIKVGNVGTGDFGGLAVSDGGAYPVQLYGSALAFLTGNSAYASATEKVRITSAGNVGIGTSAPVARLDVVSTSNVRATDNSDKPYINFSNADGSFFWGRVGGLLTGTGDGSLYFQTKTGAGLTEKMQLTDTGYLRLLSGTNGIQFGGDTAAANALDDYEEGTWTMGVSFGGASVGVTTSANTGTYVKIGRQVTVNGYFLLTNKGSSTGIAYLTGLPFTVGNTAGNFGAASLWFDKIAFANQFQGRVNQNVTYIELEEITEAGVVSNLTNAEFANNSGIMISATYQV